MKIETTNLGSHKTRAQTKLPEHVTSTLRGHLALLDPVTWASGPQGFLGGAIASGGMKLDWATCGLVVLGLTLVGPLTIGFSQSINDFFDRDVDAINEPTRPIPAGLVTLRGAILNFTVVACLALLVSVILMLTSQAGPLIIVMTILGLLLGVFYSMPPLEFKRNGLSGPLSVGLGYTMLTWMAGLLIFGPFKMEVFVITLVNVFISTGLLILNDLKSIEGDRTLGLRTLPVLYGARGALKISYAFIDSAQVFFTFYLFFTGHYWIGLLQVLALLVQLKAQRDLYITPSHKQFKIYLLSGNGFILLISFLAAFSFGGYTPFSSW
ncbi:MAG: (bacterio)chlorophyll synthase [Chloroflexota bacterium]|nr:UbiA family prenyltransferase [Chloroflexota bacterium]